MSDFEDFIEYVYDNPYDYDYVFRRNVRDVFKPIEYSKTPPPRKTAADSQREYREKLQKESAEKYENLKQQTGARILECPRRKQEKKECLQRRELEQHADQQNGLNENDELLRTRLNVENRRNTRNFQRRTVYKRKNIIEELRDSIKEIKQKYSFLERKCNRQQKKIVELEKTCKYLKTELNSLKGQNTTANTECEVGDTEMPNEDESLVTIVKMEEAYEDDPISLVSQCNPSTTVKVDEDISEEDPVNLGSESTYVKLGAEDAELDPISLGSQCDTSTNVKVKIDTAEDPIRLGSECNTPTKAKEGTEAAEDPLSVGFEWGASSSVKVEAVVGEDDPLSLGS